jgi:hypothetical protein
VQALRWPVKEPDSSFSATDSGQQARRKIHVTLPDVSYEPAAMAVLSAMYLVMPVQELLGNLTQQQLLQTAVLADMLGAPVLVDAAVKLLTAAANSAEGLEAAAAHHLLAMTAVPDCLSPLLRQTLFGRFGDLEAVWADAGLRESLLNLPVQAMELLLLSSHSLKVSSEVRLDPFYLSLRQYPGTARLCQIMCCFLQSQSATRVYKRMHGKYTAAELTAENAVQRCVANVISACSLH